MNSNAIKQLVILVLCGIAAVLAGSLLASQSYDTLLLVCYLLLGIYVLAAPGFVPLIAFGILNPFILPIPFIYNVPFMLLILAICCVKLFFRTALSRFSMGGAYQHCLTWGCILFFSWVAMRYFMRPVLPNLSGFGANVTGFRSYFSYGICFALILLLPFFLTSRDDVVRLLRWIGGISLFFILLFVPFVFSKSIFAALWLQRFGVFVSAFDNGWLRFVVLPGFGLNLLMLSLFPRIIPAPKWVRLGMAVLGLVAIFLGGNRGTVIMVFVMLLAILLLRGRISLAAVLVFASAALLVSFQYIGERLDVRNGLGVLRVMSLGSERIARETGAADTVEWRMIRWKRALEEIRSNPLFGKGYGGLENAWIWSDWVQFEEARVEVDLATGGIHNGYITAAYSLGIPAVLFFVVAMGGQIIASFRRGRGLVRSDALSSDLHSLIFANLVGLVPAIYVGTDLNAPVIWLYLALGVLLSRLTHEQSIPKTISSPTPIEPILVPVRSST